MYVHPPFPMRKKKQKAHLVFEADHLRLHLHEVLHAVDEFRVVSVTHPGDLAALLRLELLQGNLCMHTRSVHRHVERGERALENGGGGSVCVSSCAVLNSSHMRAEGSFEDERCCSSKC